MVAVDLTARYVSLHLEPGDDVDIDVTVPSGWQTGTWTAAVYAGLGHGIALVTATVTVAGQVVSVAIDGDTLANLIPTGGTKFTGWWTLRRTSGDTRTWLAGPLVLGGGQTIRNGTQSLTVLVDGTSLSVEASTGVTLSDVTDLIAAIDVAEELDDLTDVAASAPTDGDVLGWDGDTETWGPVDPTAELGDLAMLDEVTNTEVSATAAIALTKLASIATARLLGNDTGSAAAPVALTAAEAKTLLAIVIGDVSGLQDELDSKVDLVGASTVTGSIMIQSVAENAAFRLIPAFGETYLNIAGGTFYATTFTDYDEEDGPHGTERRVICIPSVTHEIQLGNRISLRNIPGTSAEVMFFDAFAGTAGLGGKNGLATLNFVGRGAVSGAPAAGTWDTGDLMVDSDGVWHLCTAGGEPGTWT